MPFPQKNAHYKITTYHNPKSPSSSHRMPKKGRGVPNESYVIVGSCSFRMYGFVGFIWAHINDNFP